MPKKPVPMIRDLLKAVGMTQKALAEAIGVTQPAITQWTVTPLERLVDVSRALNLKPQDVRPDVFDM